MSSKMMDVIVYPLTSVATMNAKLWMSNLAGKMDKKVRRERERGRDRETEIETER